MISTSPYKLTLVGVVHRDPAGEERLTSLLERLHPDRITLEISPAAVEYRQHQGRLLMQRLDRIVERLAETTSRSKGELDAHPAVGSIRSLLELPFEFRSVQKWTAGRRTPLDLLDSSEVSLAKLRRVEQELISYRNLKTLINLPSAGEAGVAEGYPAARAMLDGASESVRRAFLAGCRGSEGVGPRDRMLAAAIRTRLTQPGCGHLLHIGGWVHLVDDPDGETLYTLLAPYRPQRLLLGAPQSAEG